MSNKKFHLHLHLQLHAISRLSRFIVAALAFSACTDEQFSELPRGGTDSGGDGIGFSITVAEQADLIYDYGRTRAAEGEAAPDSATCEANSFLSHPLQGGESWNLRVHRMPLPIMGIHPHTVNCPSLTSPSSPADTSFASVNGAGEAAVPPVAATRASLEDIVGSDLRTFHDSMTVWGYTYIPTYIPTTGQAGYDSKRDELCYQRVLYDQILVKKIRGWRNSVHWPYDLDFYKTAGFTPADKPNKMRFYAYAPSLENLDITLKNSPSCTVAPQIQFIVPDNPADQRDLLYGYSDEIDVQTGPMPGSGGSGAGHYEGSGTEKEEHLGDDDKTVPLTFRHILTAVRFAQGNMPVGCNVKKIQLHGIPNQGTYDPAASSGSGAWSGQTGSKTYVVSTDYTVATHVGAANAYIDCGNVLLLLPGTMTAAQTMEITLNDGSRDHTLTCSLAGDSWQPGYTVTYKITVGEVQGDYYLLLDAGTTPVDVPAADATHTETKYKQDSRSHEQTDDSRSGTFTIHSYRNYKDYSTNAAGVNRHHAVKWQLVGFAQADESTYQTATYTLDKDAVPGSWITSFDGWNRSDETATEQDGGGNLTVSYALAEQQKVYTGNHATALAGNLKDNISNLDLSTRVPIGNGKPRTIDCTTANCYIVNCPGSFSFPIVYGNAYENETEKKYSDGSPSDALNPGNIFKDHRGEPIKYANIFTQVNTGAGFDSPIVEDITSELTSDERSAGGVKKTRETSYNEGTTAATRAVEILWQDVAGLFTDATFTSEPSTSTLGYIGFTVQAGVIQPGNCVIACKAKRTTTVMETVYDNSDNVVGTPIVTTSTGDLEILWTWHIWLTDEVLDNNSTIVDDTKYPSYNGTSRIVALENHGGTTRNILPVNLGWVPDDMAWGIYEPREVWVKIKQVPAESDQVIYLKLRLEAQQDKVTGTSTVYQWGRPTALPMVKKMDGDTRTIWNADATPLNITSSFSVMSAVSDFEKTAIANPFKMLTLWGSQAYWSSTSKTLYDPCPPGYQLPPRSVFSGMVVGSTAPAEDTPYSGTNLNVYAQNLGAGGAYFFAAHHTTAPTAGQRYNHVYYLPKSGYYKGAAGTVLSSAQQNPGQGYLWFADYIPATPVANMLEFTPDATPAGTTVQFGTMPPQNALPVRPMATN
ncbi:MAG: hypothetical protein IJ142_02770 [Bacteroidaceae bacterium]|nr:hypothetical protein [Bacteroidaceae bacterium]